MLKVLCSFLANKNTKEPYAVRHEFIASHHTMPTKVDQLKKMRDFKDHIINKQDAERSKMLPSTKEVLGIERKLKKVKDLLKVIWLSFELCLLS